MVYLKEEEMKNIIFVLFLSVASCGTPQPSDSCYGQQGKDLEECLQWQRTRSEYFPAAAGRNEPSRPFR